MSRTSKNAKKEKSHVKHATGKDHNITSTGARGPSQTTPTHGKKNRLPYDNELRKAIVKERQKVNT